jgi:hypothetical protein
MNPAVRALLTAAGLLFGTGVIAVVILFAVAITSGKTIAGGERAVVIAGVLDFLLAVGGVLFFWFANGGLKPAHRFLSTGLFGIVDAAVILAVFVMTIVVLNR